MKKFCIIVGALICLLCIPPSSSALHTLSSRDQDILLAKMTEQLRSVKTLQAEFIQERHLSLFLDVLRAEGSFYFELPGRLRWELREPYASILIFNEGGVAKFNMEQGRLRKLNLGMEDLYREVLKQIISIMSGNFSAIRDTYTITIIQGSGYHLTMTPTSGGMAKIIKSLDLSIDPVSYHVTKIVISEPQGDRIEITFSGKKENIPLDRRLFDLHAPLQTTSN